MKLNKTINLLVLLFISITTLVKCTNKKEIEAPLNKPPMANAGTEQTTTLNNVILDGSKSTDEDGTIVTYKWEKIMGASTFVIVNADQAITTVTGLAQGSYIFQLTVTDDKGASNTATVKINVNPTPNKPPVAKAGDDQTITLPVSMVKLNPTHIPSTDPDGVIVKYEWTNINGQNGYTIETPNKDTTIVSGLKEGKYIFQLTVTDNKGAFSSDTVNVTVNKMVEQKPLPKAANASITMPVNTVMLDGSGSTDYDGISTAGLSYNWEYVSSSSIFDPIITNATTATPTIGNLLEEVTYTFKLTVTNSKGLSNSINVKVTVNVPLPGIWKSPAGSPSLNLTIDNSLAITKADVTIGGTTRTNLSIIDYAIISNRQVSGSFSTTEAGITYTYTFEGLFDKPNYTQLKITSLKLNGTEALMTPLILVK